MRFEHPDDDNSKDRTVVRVPLPEPVPPGGEVSFDVAWKARLPRVFARTGYVRDYFLVGQWFPKLGVYEPAGMRGRAAGGWNCHQFHANSEFYADFGKYHVSITLPARFVVGATGPRVEKRANPDGTTTHVFEQADVIDFAWTASPDFVEVESTFDATKDVTPEEYAEAAKLLGRSPSTRCGSRTWPSASCCSRATARRPRGTSRRRRPRSSGSASGTAVTRTRRSPSSTRRPEAGAREGWSTRPSSPRGRRS